jgi:prepilin-type N-terminal cleavage/methylation domain-containing protein/prepilin-type processing-associated H-X9-DG protein
MRLDRHAGTGFTLVELLVVITIIGILIALLLPAVQSARESARRGQCLNNLKQLALALHDYHGTYQIFPPSSNWNGISPQSGNTANLSPNWVITILPFLEQQALFNSFVLAKNNSASPGTQVPVYLTDPLNQTARGTQLPVMLCPSDAYNLKPFNGSTAPGGGTSSMGNGWARGNYAANGGLGLMATGGTGLSTGADPSCWRMTNMCGVMGANMSLGLTEIKDGSSNTLLLAEIRAGITSYDSRGVWAMSGACPSALWAHGSWGDDNGPDSNQPKADDCLACGDIKTAMGGTVALARMGMACSEDNGPSCWPNWQQTARSMHRNGVNVALADGSVRWISDFIDISSGNIANNPPTYSVWDRLNLSNDGQSLDQSKF